MTIIQKNVYFRFHNDFRFVCFDTGCFQQTIAFMSYFGCYMKKDRIKKNALHSTSRVVVFLQPVITLNTITLQNPVTPFSCFVAVGNTNCSLIRFFDPVPGYAA